MRRRCRKWRKEMAAIVSAALVFGSIWPATGIFAGAAEQSRIIENFEALSDDTLYQTVPYGTKKKSLDLPKYLNARLENMEEESEEDSRTKSQTGQAATPSQATSSDADRDESDSGDSGKRDGFRKVKVSWILNEDFSEQDTYDGQIPGLYVFEAELVSEKYELGGAELPVIEVEVLKEEEKEKEAQEATPPQLREEVQEEIQEGRLVTDWTYLDGEILSEDGGLTLYGDSYTFDEVVSLLPGRIQAVTETGEGGSVTKTLSLVWDCPEYREREEEREDPEGQEEAMNQDSNSYLFMWELPEGYVLSESAGKPELPVNVKTGALSLEEQARRIEDAVAAEDAPVDTRMNVRSKSLTAAHSSRRLPDDSVFVIGSPEVLEELREKTNAGETWMNGTVSYAESRYRLTGDVRLTGKWTPIGAEDHPFTGEFDGDGHTVYGLTVSEGLDGNAGLFGAIEGGTVEKLGVNDARISAEGNAGVIAGAMRGGQIVRCCTAGTVTLSGEGGNAGGIAGSMEQDGGAAVENCYSRADVSGENGGNQKLGGIVGHLNAGQVAGCYSTGNIAGDKQSYRNLGGIAGFAENGTAVRSCAALNLAVDNFTASDTEPKGTDRVVGTQGPYPSESEALLEHNYAFIYIRMGGGTGVYQSGGEADRPGGQDLEYAAGSGFLPALGTIFTDTDVWETADGFLPALKDIKGQNTDIPDWILKQDNGYHISSEADLKEFRDRVNAGENFKGRTVKLAADIELTGDWTPIGTGTGRVAFSGTFDGGGHVISNVNVDITTSADNDNYYAGLFGTVSGGTLENLGVKNADIRLHGGGRAGALVGSIGDGTVRNCYSTGRIFGDAADSISSIGGLIGFVSNSTVENCYSLADVTSESALSETGGLIGGVLANIRETLIINCYAAGTVTGEWMVGGMAGVCNFNSNNAADFRHCAALNRSVDGKETSFTKRIAGNVLNSVNHFHDNYAFSGMTVKGATVQGESGIIGTNLNGKDLTYNSMKGTFNLPWDQIFDSQYMDGDGRSIYDVWTFKEGCLPTLKDVAGQDGAMPPWITDQAGGDLLYIGTEAELISFRDKVNSDDYAVRSEFQQKNVLLTADIRLTKVWEPIGNLSSTAYHGVFDGGGHIISNLVVESGAIYIGLFGVVENGTIQNLGVEDARIAGDSVSGAIAGLLYGGEIRNCYTAGTTVEAAFAGGLAGFYRGEPTVRNCHSGGVVRGSSGGGGLVAASTPGGSTVSKLVIENSYSTATVTSVDEDGAAGGLFGGTIEKLEIDNCAALNDSVVSGAADRAHRITNKLRYHPDGSVLPADRIKLENNYAFSGIMVNGEAVRSDDGAGLDGRDGELEDITQNPDLFPDSDWIRTQGCYPVLKAFPNQEPVPFGEDLEDQQEGRAAAFTLSLPDSGDFPGAEEGYGAQSGKTVAISSTGTVGSGDLTITLSGDIYAFILSDAVLPSIPAGGSRTFTVTPAVGLSAGAYQAEIAVDSVYGLRETAAVRFTVTEAAKRRSSSRDSGVNPAVLHGSWEHPESDIWKFKLMSGGYAKSRWGLVGGRWYYFDAEGRMATGWRYDAFYGNWYYLASLEDTKRIAGLKEGDMITGWYFDLLYQRWFYLDEGGAMVTGWREIDGNWYYFNPVSDGTRGALVSEETAARLGEPSRLLQKK